ncbi:FAD-dependent monooxygenase [Streptomyces sp. ME19-01-6]|uniref:FAD-dependent monooxygenase n=1 Tax=Streptomyces sp. ME19-01-6 TaxID=3028686 RepID=UPI0029BA70C1|nr:FAD-dependent monooxygenase [Streptomyces sp. ME19-01-6]MDX3233494.1 FAD-dependent monooxygenase [Streptomyces sp. ME19-01-6]
MDPVIIAGAGPVGLALTLALARAEVPVILLDESPGEDERRPARTAVLRPDTAALLERLGCRAAQAAVPWNGWRTMRRRQVVRRLTLVPDGLFPLGSADGRNGRGYDVGYVRDDGFIRDDGAGGHGGTGGGPEGDEAEEPELPSPLHLPQHELTRALRAALATVPGEDLVRIVSGTRVDALEQDARGVSVHTRGAQSTWWRGSYLIGCDGPRSTVRKLLGVRFPGRTAVERHAVAALRAELPWPGEAVLHRSPPWRTVDAEVTARPLPRGVWRLDWLLPPGRDLVTPDALLARVHDTLTGWCGDPAPPYELVDTGVHTVHHRLARRWRVGRAFLAGDAAHLLGALGTQGLDEGLRDSGNLSWKLALAWHQGATDALLDSYQAERRGAVSARLRAADQALPLVRASGGWHAVRRSVLPGAVRAHDALLTDGHLGRGPLGEPPVHSRSPLMPAAPPEGSVTVDTEIGAPAADVPVTASDGALTRLRARLGRELLVVLVAPGTGVWDRRHWLRAGLMPRLAAAVAALPVRAELLVAEEYPGAPAHTVLLVRPDGHLVAALTGVRPAELYACADAALGGKAARGGAADGPSVEAEATAHR